MVPKVQYAARRAQLRGRKDAESNDPEPIVSISNSQVEQSSRMHLLACDCCLPLW